VTPTRLLLDQMLDTHVARALAVAGYDVVRLADVGMARADDAEVLRRAGRDGRVLVTLDEHFGDWTVLPLSEHNGVVRVKADPATTDRVIDVLLAFLARHHDRDLHNTLAIVRSTGIRWIRTGPGE